MRLGRGSHRATAVAPILLVAVLSALLAFAGLATGPEGAGASVPGATSVTGTIRDGSSAPVAGVTVSVFGAYYGNLWGAATTDVNGTYSVSTPPGVNVKVRVDDPTSMYRQTFNGDVVTWSAAPTVTVGAVGPTNVDITVGPYRGAIAGTVTTGGAPFAGVQVEAVNAYFGATAATTTTAADGSYTLANLTPTNYKVRFTGPGEGGAVLYNGPTIAWPDTPNVVVTSGATATVDQNMPDGGTITGTVTAGGLPRSGLYVGALRSAEPPELIRYAVTDATGAYTITRLAPGGYKLIVIDPVAVSSNATAGLRPVMWPDHDLLAETMDTAQAAAPDVVVTAGGPTIAGFAVLGMQCVPTLKGANLSGANLSGADLTGCDLTGTNLTNAVLTGADLTGSNLSSVNLAGADLTGATLAGVTSGGIGGTPAALPEGWSIVGGYLVGPQHLGVDWVGAASGSQTAGYWAFHGDYDYVEDLGGPYRKTRWIDQDLVPTRSGRLVGLRLNVVRADPSGYLRLTVGGVQQSEFSVPSTGVVTVPLSSPVTVTAGTPVHLNINGGGWVSDREFLFGGSVELSTNASSPPSAPASVGCYLTQGNGMFEQFSGCSMGNTLWVQAFVV